MICTPVVGDEFQIILNFEVIFTNKRVVVHEVEELAGADGERADDLARLEHLAAVGDAPFLHQRDDAVAEHFRVDPELVVVAQRREDGVGDASNS